MKQQTLKPYFIVARSALSVAWLQLRSAGLFLRWKFFSSRLFQFFYRQVGPLVLDLIIHHYLTALRVVYIYVYPLRWLCWAGLLPYGLFWFSLVVGTLALQRRSRWLAWTAHGLQRGLDRLLFAQGARWAGPLFRLARLLERRSAWLLRWFWAILALRLCLVTTALVGFPLAPLEQLWGSLLFPLTLLLVFLRTLGELLQRPMFFHQPLTNNFEYFLHWVFRGPMPFVITLFLIRDDGQLGWFTLGPGDGMLYRSRKKIRVALEESIRERYPFFPGLGLEQDSFEPIAQISLPTFLYMRALFSLINRIRLELPSHLLPILTVPPPQFRPALPLQAGYK